MEDFLNIKDFVEIEVKDLFIVGLFIAIAGGLIGYNLGFKSGDDYHVCVRDTPKM